MNPTTPLSTTFGCHSKFKSHHSATIDLSNDAQRDAFLVAYIEEASFANGVWLDWICFTRKPTKGCDSRISNRRFSIFVFSQETMISALHPMYVFLSMEEVENLRLIGWYRPVLVSFPGIFSKPLNHPIQMQAIVCASSVLLYVFIRLEKANIIYPVYWF